MNTSWVAVSVQPGLERAAVLAALFAGGVQAVQEIDGGFSTSIAGSRDAERLKRAVLAAAPQSSVELAPLPAVDWTEQWKASIKAHELGAFVVCPPWLADQVDASRRIVIDPAMAFGTGEHETTRGVIRLLQGVIKAGDRVADLGAGSAILAIAAAKLGAKTVAAIEIDPDAIENAEENVERNGVADRVTVIEGDATILVPLVAPVRVITANIISSVIVVMLPVMATALSEGGQAILSGILVAERGEMLAALTASGWTIQREDAEGAWWSAVITQA